MNIFQISKYARTGDPDSLEENLLTAIFCWVIERDSVVLEEALSRCRGVVERHNRVILELEFPRTLSGDELEIDFQLRLRSGNESGIADFGIDDGSTMLIGESKVECDSIDLEQILGYYRMGTSMFHDREVFVLCLTPDNVDVATKTLGDIPAEIRDRFFWISWEEIWKACDSLETTDISEEIVRREIMEGIEMAEMKPFRGFEDSVVEIARNIGKLDQIGEFFTWVENIFTDPGGLNLESDGKLRHHSSESRAYADEVYKLFWERHWKNKGRLNACYGVDFKFAPIPVLGAWLWFPPGQTAKAFREISPSCDHIESALKERFKDTEIDAGLWVAGEADFYVRIPLDHTIAQNPENLRRLLVSVIEYLRGSVVPELHQLGWEF